jgi:hypothetical protein
MLNEVIEQTPRLTLGVIPAITDKECTHAVFGSHEPGDESTPVQRIRLEVPPSTSAKSVPVRYS